MDTAAGDYPPGDSGASGPGHDRALPGLSEAFQTGPGRAESGQRSGQALRAAAVMPVASPIDRRVIWVGGIVFAVLMALSPQYGFDRDELYFLDGARHLQAGYVDQPVLGPLLAWVSLKLFGVSLPGLRVWPALAAWGTVVVGGLIAREFGGARRAQLLAAIGTATMPVLYMEPSISVADADGVLRSRRSARGEVRDHRRRYASGHSGERPTARPSN